MRITAKTMVVDGFDFTPWLTEDPDDPDMAAHDALGLLDVYRLGATLIDLTDVTNPMALKEYEIEMNVGAKQVAPPWGLETIPRGECVPWEMTHRGCLATGMALLVAYHPLPGVRGVRSPRVACKFAVSGPVTIREVPP